MKSEESGRTLLFLLVPFDVDVDASSTLPYGRG